MLRFRIRPLVLALAAALAAGQSQAGTDPARDEVAAGLQSLAQYDYARAEIHLKSALQQRPDLIEAQVALARVHLQLGRLALAESTLQSALRIGADRSTVDPLRMRIRYLQGDFQAVLDGFDPYRYSGATRAAMLRLRGEARLEFGLDEDAQRSFDAARAAAADSPDGDIGLSELALHRQDPTAAREAAGRATQLAPRSVDAWSSLAAAELAAGELAPALAAADRALSLDGRAVPALAARVSALSRLGRHGEAQQSLERLQSLNPRDLHGLMLAAEVARARNDPQTARARLTDASLLIQAIPRDALLRRPSLLLLSGTVHEALGLSEKARADLTQYLERRPDDLSARRLLASVLLHDGEAQQALELLQPLPADLQTLNDPRLLTLLADAYGQLRQYATAVRLLERLIELGGANAAVLAELGSARLRSGQGDEALAALGAAWAQSADPRQGLLFASLQLGAGQTQAALHTLDALAVRVPDQAVVLHLRGGARLANGDRQGARADFERVVQLAPGLDAAVVNLARLDALEGRPADGIARLERRIAEHPDAAALRTDLGQLLLASGRDDAALRAWEQARALDERALQPRLALASYRLAHREPLAALTLAQEAVGLAPESAEALAALGMSQLALQLTEAAQATFRTLAGVAGQNLPRLLRAAQLQMLARAAPDAVDTLERARQIAPQQAQVLLALAEAQHTARREAAAEATARALLDRPEPPAEAWGLLGEILMASGRAAEAADVYAAGQARHPRSAYAVAIWRAGLAAGDPGRGLPALEAWAAQHPDDPEVRAALAVAWPQAGAWSKAQGLYEQLAAARPDDAMILNNLALLYLRARDTRAIATARRAQAIAQRSPIVLDTLGWVLVQFGQYADGLRFLQAAQAADPANPELLWHLGYALERLGRRMEARQPLEKALASSADFDGVHDARALLASLSVIGRR